MSDNKELYMARPLDRALASEAATRLQPAAFDPSRITEAVQAISPKCLDPIIRRAADEFYCTVLAACEGYLLDNLDYNTKSQILQMEEESARARRMLYEIGVKVLKPYAAHDDVMAEIAYLQEVRAYYLEIVGAVARKFDGETRRQTALRYVQEREASDSDRSGEAVETTGSTEGESAGPQDIAQGSDHDPQ